MDFDKAVARIERARDWDAALASVTNPTITSYPEYYTKPFHGAPILVSIDRHQHVCAAYPQGNLNWDAAFEVGPAAVSVHANVMDPAGKLLQPEYAPHRLPSFSPTRQLTVAMRSFVGATAEC